MTLMGTQTVMATTMATPIATATVKRNSQPTEIVLVMEPFLTPDRRGLQVWDCISGNWMDCDGTDSPCVQLTAGPATDSSSHENQQEGHEQQHAVSLLFGGKALAAYTDIEATLHRVVAGSRNRRAVIYGQIVDR
jgi:hypothetical protein